MDFQLFPIFVIILSVPMVGVNIYLYRNRHQREARSLLLLLVSVLGWMITNTLELVTPTEAATLFWGKVTYFFIVSTPVLWLFFVLDYFGYSKWKKYPGAFLYWLIPIASLILVFTNEQHHLFWAKTTYLPVGNYLALIVVHGPFFFITWGYAQVLIFLGIAILLRENLGNSARHRWRVIWVSIGAVLVAAFSIVYVLRIIPNWQKDYTPVGLALGGLCFVVAISKYNLLDVVAIGKATLFEAMDDGMLVVDDEDMLVKINQSALRLLNIKESDVLGKSYTISFPHFPSLATLAEDKKDQYYDICLSDTLPFYVNLKTNPIVDHSGHLRGYLILIRDATTEKVAQIAEHEEREFAQALSEITSALNSTRNLDELLDIIISNLAKVTACDAADIMMINKGRTHIVRSLTRFGARGRFSINKTANYHWMLENRLPLAIPNVTEYLGWVTLAETAWIRSYVGAPIITMNEVIGFISLYSATPNFYNQKIADRLFTFANQASVAIQNARIYTQLEKLATTDSLTNLPNRRYFFGLATREFARAIRYQHDISVIMMDLDHLKRINDTYGHLSGDQALVRFAQICSREIRTVDSICRFGGDEFTILLPETNLDGAKEMANRLCQEFCKKPIETPRGKFSVTASLGVACIDPNCHKLEDLLQHADYALYHAKNNGRNRVEIFTVSSDASIQPPL
jgi:diguanylate cyclase (GGDEF)-like protein